MHEFDKRMLFIIDELIRLKIVENKTLFCEKIGMNLSTIFKIMKGINHFTALQIQSTCLNFRVNANFVFGIEENIFIEKKTD